MIKRFGYIVLVLTLLVGCKVKRSANSNTAITTAKQKKRSYKPNDGIAETQFNKSELYPLPTDPGRFVKFPINSTIEYIEEFAEIAQYEMRAFGIPASITLAQGILESGSGKGQLTLKTNNHFGIKCHTDWQGEYDFHDDDAKGECFRKYNHPMFSFRDHSIFLASRLRYHFLFNYRKNDFKRWAYGLHKAGYATDQKYPQKLIALINKYDLDAYDKEVIKNGLDPNPVRKPKEYDVFTYVVEKGDTLYGLSRKYTIPVDEIMKLNSLDSTNLAVGQILNLRKAKKK